MSSNKKRKAELTDEQITSTEEALFAQVTAAYGSKATSLAVAHDLATRAQKDLKRARTMLFELDDKQIDNEVVLSLFRQFNEQYPEVDVPDAVRRRNPTVFRTWGGDTRSEKKKQEDAKHAARDAEFIERYTRRKAAKERILKRSNDLVEKCKREAREIADVRFEHVTVPRAVTDMVNFQLT